VGLRRSLLVGVVAASTLTGVSATASGAATADGSANDKELATAGVLVASDLPTSYTQAPRDTESDTATTALAKRIPACKKLAAFMTAVKKNPEAKSEDFNQGQTIIDNTVTVFPSATKAKAAMAGFAAAGLPTCFAQLVSKLAQQMGARAQASIKKVNDLTAGDQATAYEGPVAIRAADGSTANLAFGNLAIRIGRAVAVYSYNHDAQTDISADLRTAVENSGSRLQNALQGGT
jgi:hypothetical protein